MDGVSGSFFGPKGTFLFWLLAVKAQKQTKRGKNGKYLLLMERSHPGTGAKADKARKKRVISAFNGEKSSRNRGESRQSAEKTGNICF